MKPFNDTVRTANTSAGSHHDTARRSDDIKRDIRHTRHDMDLAFHELERRIQDHPVPRFVRLAYGALRQKPWISILIALFVIGLFKRALRT
jgi:hypothetical protein